MTDWIMQGALFALSAAAITLLSGTGRLARWGWWLGLASQPFWLIETARAEQWGMCALSAYYSFIWARGACNHGRGRG